MSAVTVLYPISIELVGYNGEQLALRQKFFAFSLPFLLGKSVVG